MIFKCIRCLWGGGLSTEKLEKMEVRGEEGLTVVFRGISVLTCDNVGCSCHISSRICRQTDGGDTGHWTFFREGGKGTPPLHPFVVWTVTNMSTVGTELC